MEVKDELTDDVNMSNLPDEDLSAGHLDTHLFQGDIWTQINTGKKGKDLEEYIEDVKESARVAIDQSIAILTPWFFSNMPQFYYETTPRAEKVRDLHAVITGHIFESKQKLQLWNRHRTKTTFLAPGTDDHIFIDIGASVDSLEIKHGTMFTSNDRLLLISSFFTKEFEPVNLDNTKNLAKVERAFELLKDENAQDVRDFLTHLDDEMVIHTTPERMARLYKLFGLARDREEAATNLIPRHIADHARLDVVYKKMPISKTLPALMHLFDRHGFRLNRCIMALVNQHTNTPFTVFTFIIRHDSGQQISDKFVPFLKLNKALKTLRWVDMDHYDKFWMEADGEEDSYSINEVNVIRSMASWSQIFLSKINPYYYSEERIRKTYSRHPEILKTLVSLFKLRFDPRETEGRKKVGEVSGEMLTKIGNLSNDIEADILQESHKFVMNILKTNYFFPQKTGLAFRMDPKCLDTRFYPNTPYGFFYMVGRGYRGFHVRFRDTARGGLRIVMPRDAGNYEANFAGLFDEVIGLAYAQQLKNKDIPEGGAKAVVLLTPGADRETAAIGAVDSILNLIAVDTKTGKMDPSIIDYFNQEEYIYLGPDENCTNELIESFVRQANRRRYRYANAFMSSKPGAGINHKTYGVTSEGLNVYLENMLKELGIDPQSQTFTVKMTGGPDGDVAGNELKILHREYGENAKVLAIGDGLGAAFDPNGLNWDELLRLVHESLSIKDFDAGKLSGHKDAFVIPADTLEHQKIRNTLFAVTEADIFIPAGGRPYSVNEHNWKLFLKEGKPTMKAIVEGANIFFTDDARERLQEQGVLIFKDSSANKCGVICSSFEILASLILTPEEFLAIKDVYVEQVVVKLREKADLEAKLLLREFHERGRRQTLVELSKVVSSVINRVTDLVSSFLDTVSESELGGGLFEDVILNYSPKILTEQYAKRILHDIPRSYRQAIVSADTAARIVYAEGISWLENLADEDIVQTVRIYVRKERKVRQILESMEQLSFEDHDEVVKILRFGGARALTQLKRNL